jgi:hypothetical protein
MANTAEGITVGDEQGLDPNDPADFEAIMAGRGVVKEEGEETTPDRSIAAGLTTAAGPEQPAAAPVRDEKGRFVSNQERAAATKDTAAAAATDTSGTETPTGDFADPAVQEFLQKYDGNVEEALKGAANAQALIGRREERTAEMGRELAELRGLVQGLQAGRGAAAPAVQPMSDDQVVEVAAGRIQTLGYEGAATEAANHSHTTGDDRALRTILEQWQLEAPFEAMNFLTDFKLWQREQAAAERGGESTPPAWQQSVEEQWKVSQYGAGLTALKAELGDEAFASVAAKLDDALDQMPANVLAMIDSNDPEARDAGFRIVADRALRLAGAAPAAPAAQQQQPTPPSVERKLSGARVASGALRPAPKTPDAPTNREDAIKEFKRQIVEAPTTSIASGLTYGPQP